MRLHAVSLLPDASLGGGIHGCKFTPADWNIAGIMVQCYTREPKICFLLAQQALSIGRGRPDPVNSCA
jgi:hypothetical protein